MIEVAGKIVDEATNTPLANYQILVAFDSLIGDALLDVDGAASLVLTNGSARSDGNGEFSISIEPMGEPKDPVTIEISAPDGRLVKSNEISVQSLSERLDLNVESIDPFEVTPSDVDGLGQRLRLNGRVIDSQGKTVAAELPIVLWGVKNGADGAELPPHPLLITQTQVGGLFSGDWPKDKLSKAFGRVEGGAAIPVPLDDRSQLVRKVLLVTSIDDADDDPCDCDNPTPRAPDQEDLTNNPEAFSQDLGGGCADLTLPNRTLEEFRYSYVVRTSQPRVKALI